MKEDVKKKKKELTVDEHNAAVFKEIKELQSKIDELKKTTKSESLKVNATLQECIAMNKKAQKIKPLLAASAPNTNSL